MELGFRVGIHGEQSWLALFYLSDVSFVNTGFDLHFGKVLGDDEKIRRAETRRHGLTDVYASADYHSSNGGRDGAVVQVCLGLLQRSFGAGKIPGATVSHNLGGIQFLLGNELVPEKPSGACQLALGIRQGGFGLAHVGLGILYGGRVYRGINLSDGLALLDLGVVVHVEIRNGARYLGTHGHLDEA